MSPIGPISVALMLAAAGASAAGGPVTAAEARKDLQELRARIEALQKQLSAAEDSRVEATDALKESERAISEVNRRLRDLAQQSATVRGQLESLRAQSDVAERSLKSQQALLARLLYQRYVSGQDEPVRLLMTREDPNRIARKLHYLTHISRARAELVDEVRETLARLAALGQEAERNAAALAAIVAEQTLQKQRLEQQKAARSEVLARIARDIQSHQREIGALRHDEKRLARLIEQLGRIVIRKPPPPRSRNERVPERSTDGAPFEVLKGRLRLPVRGELTNRFGSPRSGGGLTWKGLFIAARTGEEVRAVAAGRVVFADWLRGFGNLLIIDHGSAYMSLYGNNEALYKRVGDTIEGGDPIAAVGNSGGNTDSGLYFELRHEGKPLDPLRWVDVQ